MRCKYLEEEYKILLHTLHQLHYIDTFHGKCMEYRMAGAIIA